MNRCVDKWVSTRCIPHDPHSPPLCRVQKCAALNQMCTRNLALLFAPSVFQTDGRGEHEVRVLQELIDGYVSVFDVSSSVP